MRRGALGRAIAVVALIGATWPAAVRAQSQDVTLPRLEVPDEVRRKAVNPDRAALLNQPIELSDARDRLTLARERAAWGRLSGSLCSGCVDGRALRRTATVDPIAVLNAKPSAKPAAVLTIAPAALRPIRPPVPTVASAAPRPTPTLPASPGPAPTLPAPTLPAPTLPAPAQASADPVRVATAAVLPAAAITVRRRPSIVMRRSVRAAHAHRVRLAHRRRHHSKFSRYLGRVRYTLFHWHQRHPRRIRR